MPTRRQFVSTSALAGVSAALPKLTFGAAAPSADSRIEILLDEPQGTISPNLYGHFTEHLGGVVYDGLWSARNPKYPTWTVCAATSSST